MIGLGIDTGGTCTDAVIYDIDRQEVLSVGKVPTTKGRLEEGIGNALSKLDCKKLNNIALVSLSTTLATNACVENRGAKVKLLFIGVKRETVTANYKKYGFESMDDLFFIEGVPEGGFCTAKAPDWDNLINHLDFFDGAEAIGIVQYFPEWNNGAFEKKAKEILEAAYKVPVICGSELFSDLNAIKRGAGTYLNIRLISMIQQFLEAVRKVLHQYGIEVPVYVVRSDGTLMNESFTKLHPIETLLCGPAASALGGAWMAGEKDALVVDIGGTTTDIAIIKEGIPIAVPEGIKINGWQTFVKGLYIDTFGLGGDSAVRCDKNGVYLEKFRVMSAAMAGAKYPQIKEKLEQVDMNKKSVKDYPYEGFILQKEIKKRDDYSEKQLLLYEKLKDGPLLTNEVALLVGNVYYRGCVERLEKENIIIRFGLTPTDAMILKGDYCEYSKDTSEVMLKCFSHYNNMDAEQLLDVIYNVFEKKLYENIVRVLVEKSIPGMENGITEEMKKMISSGFETIEGYVDCSFKSRLPIIGAGGPSYTMMEQMGKLLGCKVLVHKNARVANAIGTLAGRMSASESLEISYGTLDGDDGFVVYMNGQQMLYREFNEVVEAAETYLKERTYKKIKDRGSSDEITYERKLKKYTSGNAVLGGQIEITAFSRVRITLKES